MIFFIKPEMPLWAPSNLTVPSQILTALLDRLDAAVAKAIYDGIFTDEVNR